MVSRILGLVCDTLAIFVKNKKIHVLKYFSLEFWFRILIFDSDFDFMKLILWVCMNLAKSMWILKFEWRIRAFEF